MGNPIREYKRGCAAQSAARRNMMATLLSSLSVLLLVLHAVTGALAASSTSPVPPASVPPENYVLGPSDQLQITVFGQPDLTTPATIRPDGMIDLPLVGEVKAAGKTAAQLETELVRLYRRYLKAPSISVAIRQFQMNHVYVMGEVAKPGRYELTDNMTVLDALTLAGGPTHLANLDGTHIARNAGGKNQAIAVKVNRFVEGKDGGQNFKLQTGDLVYIPRRGLNLLDILQNIGTLRSVVGF